MVPWRLRFQVMTYFMAKCLPRSNGDLSASGPYPGPRAVRFAASALIIEISVGPSREV